MVFDLTSSRRRRGAAARLAAAASLLLLLIGPSRGEILLQGSAAAVRLEVTQAPVGEILAALRQDYNIRYRASIPLDRTITGTYSGTLVRVLARVLDGYDYVARISPDAIEIAYIRMRGGPEPAAAANPNQPPVLRTSIGRLQK